MERGGARAGPVGRAAGRPRCAARPTRRSGSRPTTCSGCITPVIKGYLTDKGFEAAVYAQQVLGGHGYIREHGMEQFVRDARITQIYEGTNGIQAMDLVGRKLPKDGGRGGPGASSSWSAATSPRRRRRAIRPASPRRSSRRLQDLQAATMWLAQNGMADPDNAGAGAYAYMDLMGLVSARLDVAEDGGCGASGRSTSGAEDRALPRGQAGHRPLLCRSASCRCRAALRRKIEAGAEALMKMPAEAF